MNRVYEQKIQIWNKDYYYKYGHRRKYLIRTYGCQMNDHDSERISFLLEKMGFERTDNQADADIVLYNTCMIRENAEVKVYGHLGQLKPLKKEKKDMIIGLCGCMMQLEDIRDRIKEKHEHVDLMFGTNNINNLPKFIYDHLQSKKLVESIEDDMKIVEDTYEVRHREATRAYVNIMYGCNNFCSYCIVPYVRGREISREKEDILKEVHYLAQEGFTEIMLLGQNVNSYGKNLNTPVSFAELLEEVAKIDGIKRIRFMTSHPKDCPQKLIDVMGQNEKICPHFHLPVQSGSNHILEKMNRKYTREAYLDLVNRMKKGIPNLSLSTDIIVGFPGETKEDFQQTLDLVDKVGYDQGFMFIYSPRPGTKAASLKNTIPREVQLERFNRLMDHMYGSFRKRNEAYIGRKVEVLVESVSKNDATRMTGRTDTFKLVHFPGDSSLIGKYVNIEILNANSFSLEGKIID